MITAFTPSIARILRSVFELFWVLRFTFTFIFRAFGKRFYPKRLTIRTLVIRRRNNKHIAVGTVRLFIEPTAEHLQSLG